MKKRFTIGGAIVGLLNGAGIVIWAYIKSPGGPGLFELLAQGIIVASFVALGAVAGLIVGWLASLFMRKK